MPKTAASAALVVAMIRLFCSASTRNGFDSALPYHCVEKPVNSLALRPALKENSTTSAIGSIEEAEDGGDEERASDEIHLARAGQTRQAIRLATISTMTDDRRPA